MNGLESLNELFNKINERHNIAKDSFRHTNNISEKTYSAGIIEALGGVSIILSEYSFAIERELKVLQTLKEKKVDLPKIAEWLADNNLKDIKGTMEYYNRYIVNGYMKELTEEEMTLIVKWLKEDQND